MEIKEMTIEQLMERRAAIATELDAPEADLDALEAEARSINDEIEARKAAEAKRNDIRAAVASGDGKTVETFKKKEEERKEMNVDEIRNSAEYINAFAEYIKSGDDTECRALLTDAITVSGTAGVPVPTIVEDRIRTAWDNDDIMRRVRKTFIKGNLKVGFELSATAAVEHTEGSAAPTEEVLNLGVVELVPKTLKKWITISDEVMDMKGSAFLDYIFDEIEYRIVKLAADNCDGSHDRDHQRRVCCESDHLQHQHQRLHQRCRHAVRRGPQPRHYHEQGDLRRVQGSSERCLLRR